MTHLGDVMNRQDAWRRWFGLLFLIIAGGMTTWGLTVLDGKLKGAWFVVYWLPCFGFVFLAMSVALLDWLIIRQRHRKAKANLARKVFGSTAQPTALPPKDKPKPLTKSRTSI